MGADTGVNRAPAVQADVVEVACRRATPYVGGDEARGHCDERGRAAAGVRDRSARGAELARVVSVTAQSTCILSGAVKVQRRPAVQGKVLSWEESVVAAR